MLSIAGTGVALSVSSQASAQSKLTRTGYQIPGDCFGAMRLKTLVSTLPLDIRPSYLGCVDPEPDLGVVS